MARIRTIKPEFWSHEDLSELPAETHMLAAALLNHADDEGYFNANPKLVKAQCLPLREDSVSIHDSLSSLSAVGFIRLGEGSDGKRYGHVVNFLEHQRINRPTKSKIGALSITWEDSSSAHTQLSEDSPPEGKGREGKGKEQGTGKTPTSDESDDRQLALTDTVRNVFDHWLYRMGKTAQAKLTDKRRRCIQARLREGYDAEMIKRAIDGCAASPYHMGQNDAGTVYDDLTLICRSGDKLEWFANSVARVQPLNSQERTEAGNLNRLQAWAERKQRQLEEQEANENA